MNKFPKFLQLYTFKLENLGFGKPFVPDPIKISLEYHDQNEVYTFYLKDMINFQIFPIGRYIHALIFPKSWPPDLDSKG